MRCRAFLAACLLSACLRANAQTVETRSCELRIESNWTLSDVRAAVNRIADMGLNCVRVETFYHGGTIYTSPVMARYGMPSVLGGFAAGGSALRAVIETAHARGMTVYAWVETFYVWNTVLGSGQGPVLGKHPEWSVRNADGTMLPKSAETSYYFISPANLEARSFLKDLFAEIANTGVDGIFADYLRYPRGALGPSNALSFDSASIQRAQDELGLDITRVALDVRNSDFQRWTLWRQQQTTDAAKELADAVRAANPNVIFCGSLHPGYDADWRTHDSLRDWPAWRPEVSAFSMQYYAYGNPPSASEIAGLEGQMNADLAAAGDAAALWPNIKESDITTGMPLLAFTRQQPCLGVSYWVYSALTPADGTALVSGPFGAPSLAGETMPIRAAWLLLAGVSPSLSTTQQTHAQRASQYLRGNVMRAGDASVEISTLLTGTLPASARRDLDLARRLLHLAPNTLIRGDANRDGVVTLGDAAAIARWTAAAAPAVCRDAADATQDGCVNVLDAAAALRIVAGL